jgi:hypothetical protein
MRPIELRKGQKIAAPLNLKGGLFENRLPAFGARLKSYRLPSLFSKNEFLWDD